MTGPGLAVLLDYVRAGDTVVVVALDRLGRSLTGVIRTVERLTSTGVLLRSIREGIDYSTPTGRDAGRDLRFSGRLRARVDARTGRGGHARRPGFVAATPAGHHGLGEAQSLQVRSLRAGSESITELVRTFGVSR